MAAYSVSLACVCLLALGALTRGDTPGNCTFDDIKGHWIFYESERNHNSNIDCSNVDPSVHKSSLSLEYPNVAVDGYGNKGTWTMVYNEGFEVRVGGRSYFAFSYYNGTGDDATSYCDATLTGWSRDLTIRNWSCFRGRKVTQVTPKRGEKRSTQVNMPPSSRLYKTNKSFLTSINSAQSSWVAGPYPAYKAHTLKDMHRRNGGTRLKSRVEPAVPTPISRLRSMIMPEAFDWRNVSEVNYVSPVRNQGSCGSCYAFASMAGLESRVRILTRNSQTPVFSVQDVLECSHFSQACDGGFAYLTAGRYAQDFGVVLDECAPYAPNHLGNGCTTDPTCLRHYTAYYRYVGGYYGACNEEEMKLALVRSGPLMVGLEVYNDFMHYKGGVYHHTGLRDSFNPLEETNHAVLVVGYGFDPSTQEKFWTVKNSWGLDWGEGGYFRIKRGNDECAIESMAFEVVPIPA